MEIVRSTRPPRRAAAYTPAVHFAAKHPLAAEASRRCTHAQTTLRPDLACGSCWESAVRDDERFVVECGLSRELPAVGDVVDEVAVQRVVDGRRGPLTAPERREVARRLLAAGRPVSVVIDRVGREALHRVRATGCSAVAS